MIIKRYEGQYVHEVVAQIREELGPDAVVLHTQWRSPAGLKRLLGKSGVEVWAACRAAGDALPDEEAQAEGHEPESVRALALRQALASQAAANGNGHATALVAAEPEPSPLLTSLAAPAAAPTADDPTLALLCEFNDVLERLEGKVDTLLGPAAEDPTDPAAARLKVLLQSGIEADVAGEIAAAADGRTITEVLFDSFQCSGGVDLMEGPKVVALVGPSGAGKTTTAAKLAAHFTLSRDAKVLLATTDTRRVGAAEQLKAFAELMELQVAALRSPQDAANRMEVGRRNHDLVIIDTFAATPGEPGWDDLVDTLIAAEPDEIYLVVPASLRPVDLHRTVAELARALPLRGAVVTKLDEAVDAANLIHLAWRHLVPISYLATGREVPGDLAVATADELVELAWSSALDARRRADQEEPS